MGNFLSLLKSWESNWTGLASSLYNSELSWPVWKQPQLLVCELCMLLQAMLF